MKNQIKYVLPAAVLLFWSCGSSNSRDDIITLDIDHYVQRDFKLSDFADSVWFVVLDTMLASTEYIIQIESNKMLAINLDANYKQFCLFNMDGSLHTMVGKAGPGPEEYDNSLSDSWCLLDSTLDACLVYDMFNGSQQVKYYSTNDGRWLKTTKLSKPLPEGFYSMGCMDGHHCYIYNPREIDQHTAWVEFGEDGRIIQQKSVEGQYGLRRPNRGFREQLYRDHWLLWGYNDTLYTVNNKGWEPSYVWKCNDPSRLAPMNDRSIDAFTPSRVIDTKDWLFVVCPFRECYYFDKRNKVFYGNECVENDLGWYKIKSGLFGMYYYDASTDTEYLYGTHPQASLIEMLEEAGTPEALKFAEQFDPEGNPVVVQARLKKNK